MWFPPPPYAAEPQRRKIFHRACRKYFTRRLDVPLLREMHLALDIAMLENVAIDARDAEVDSLRKIADLRDCVAYAARVLRARQDAMNPRGSS